MSLTDACCTCATLLTDTKVPYDAESEKPIVLDRKLPCCSRTICATCQYKNARFQTYCPFCQISSEPTALPTTGLRLPPSYTKTTTSIQDTSQSHEFPPAYDSLTPYRLPTNNSTNNGPPTDTNDTVHHLSSSDTLASLSLAYQVPVPVLRSHNNLYSDLLLAARKYILIPSSHYTGPPLSTPPDPEEEERKNKVRRWMVATKCAEYEVAGLYLKGSDWDLSLAVDSFKADEAWERDNPLLKDKQKGKERQRKVGIAGSLTAQLS